MIIEKELYEFLEHGKRRSLKESTLAVHRLTLNEFYMFLRDDYPEVKEVTDITKDIITAYEQHLTVKTDARGKILSRNRRGRYLITLKLFFQYLEREEKIYRNPAVNISMPGLKKQAIKDVLKVEEMDALLKMISGHSLKSLRDRAILELLYSTGVRAEELCNVHVEDIDLDEKTLFVRRGKYNSERRVPFGESARYWVKRYLERARPLMRGTESGILFISVYGRRLTPDTLRGIIGECAKSSGIEKNITSHTFRHSCATHMLKGGADIRYVQRQLGHRNIATTEKYLKIEITDLKEIHERCHPREQEDW